MESNFFEDGFNNQQAWQEQYEADRQQKQNYLWLEVA
jgi:hypothetical protein